MTVRKPRAKSFKKRVRSIVAKAKKKLYPSKFDSKFEFELSEILDKSWVFHPKRIPYTSVHTYQPDFRQEKDGKVVLIEAKGRFRSRQESSKYLAIRSCLPDNEELIFLFYNAATPMAGAQKRKDGTKQSHGEWATLNNFRWYCNKEGLPDVIR